MVQPAGRVCDPRELEATPATKPVGPAIIRWAVGAANFRGTVLLDRDGVIVEVRRPYATCPADLVDIPGARPALERIRDAGWRIGVVTNQSGVARGLLTLAQALRLHEHVLERIDPDRQLIDFSILCPHGAGDGCSCRKPATGGVREAERRLATIFAPVWFVGDQRSDLECGLGMGARAALVLTGQGVGTLLCLTDGWIAGHRIVVAAELTDLADRLAADGQ